MTDETLTRPFAIILFGAINCSGERAREIAVRIPSACGMIISSTAAQLALAAQ